jgi:hypothetical protein
MDVGDEHSSTAFLSFSCSPPLSPTPPPLPPPQAANASLTSQLSDLQAASAREKQLLQDKLSSAEQAWSSRNKELLEQLLQRERQVAQLSLSEQAVLRQAEAATSAQVGV